MTEADEEGRGSAGSVANIGEMNVGKVNAATAASIGVADGVALRP